MNSLEIKQKAERRKKRKTLVSQSRLKKMLHEMREKFKQSRTKKEIELWKSKK